MRKQAFAAAASRLPLARRRLSFTTFVDSDLRRSVEEHFREVSEIGPPPKKMNPPPPYSIVRGALERSDGQVLRRAYGEEEITLYVTRRALAIPSPGGHNAVCADHLGHSFISELFLRVGVWRPGRSNSLLFLCGLYPDAVGIQSVCLLSNSNPGLYHGRVFLELNPKLRNEFCQYLQERAVDKRLFPFLQSWLYAKDHHNLMNWLSNMSKFISDTESA